MGSARCEDGSMSRTDFAVRVVPADPAQVFAAMVDPDALLRWLPPTGMSGRFEHADIRTGGSFRLVLTYDTAGAGKSSADSDVVEVHILDVVPNDRIVQAIEFVSDDPAFSGTMYLTWRLTPVGEATQVEIVAEDVPMGISAQDHAAGMDSSLANLAAYLTGA
jgi:uncharacterized protein YndB with AHSA1/START domain